MDQAHPILIPEKIQNTIENLHQRISDRFPNSGLAEVCRTLIGISKETKKTLEWIHKPNYIRRAAVYVFILLLILIVILSLTRLNIPTDGLNIAEFIQMIEAALEGLVMIVAGIIFLATFETRTKRKRIIRALNHLRCLAHIIDAHQLTKDPDGIARLSVPTPHSPMRTLSSYELTRYLDYCTEMLSLIGKLGFLYIQDFDDPLANNAVNDLEDLATELSQKIWQKIMILYQYEMKK